MISTHRNISKKKKKKSPHIFSLNLIERFLSLALSLAFIFNIVIFINLINSYKKHSLVK